MTIEIEFIPCGRGPPVEIGAMPPWSFWSSEAAVGSSPEEQEAMARGEVSEARVVELQVTFQMAFIRLRDIPVIDAKLNAVGRPS